MSGTVGVLALSYGTPTSREGIEPYYTQIRHGRPPTPEQLADLVRRYDAIGGLSPLNERTAEQVAGIAAALEQRAPGRFDVQSATRYASPSIEASVATLLDRGVGAVVGLVLAPLSAAMSTGQYHDRARGAIEGRVPYVAIWEWWAAPGFCELLAARVRAQLEDTDPELTLVLFSAHSLPARVVEEGSDYPEQLAAAAARVAALAGVARAQVCWQSAGRTPEPWIGPDILEVLRATDTATTTDVVVCPVGFISDHLEVLFDVDVEARGVAEERGLRLVRTDSLNADPAFLELLADQVIAAAPTP